MNAKVASMFSSGGLTIVVVSWVPIPIEKGRGVLEGYATHTSLATWRIAGSNRVIRVP